MVTFANTMWRDLMAKELKNNRTNNVILKNLKLNKFFEKDKEIKGKEISL